MRILEPSLLNIVATEWLFVLVVGRHRILREQWRLDEFTHLLVDALHVADVAIIWML